MRKSKKNNLDHLADEYISTVFGDETLEDIKALEGEALASEKIPYSDPPTDTVKSRIDRQRHHKK